MKLAVALAAALTMIGSAARAQEPQPGAQGPVVVTTGEGVVRRAPDRAWVTVAAESRAKTPQDAQRLNAEAMSAVLQKLKGAGLPGDAIQTTGYDLQPEYDYVNNRQTLRGYVARNTLEVRVDVLSQVGEVVDLAVGSGASVVRGVRFGLKDRTAAELEALRLAVADARERAAAAASGAGMRVDRIVRIEEHGIGVMPPPRPMVTMRAEMAQAPATPVEPGELEIRAQVRLTAAIR
ncbi:MAG TPA: SIMPL domain-containing protein [Vicinamibacterales bacterium]|nr:SIMPL domain-containing protein [Vicinamibacterales bacterium]